MLRASLSVGLGFVLLTSGLLLARGDQKQPDRKGSEVHGRVDWINRVKSVIRIAVSERKQQEFKFNDQTKIVGIESRGAEASNQDAKSTNKNTKGARERIQRLRRGTEVTVVFENEEGQNVAKEIRVEVRGGGDAKRRGR
jgi:hypothetical protein